MQHPGTEAVPASHTEVLFRTLVLPLPRALAFGLFTARTSQWWSRGATASPKDLPWAQLVLGTDRGSRWFERDIEGGEHEWGVVTEAQAPERIVVDWRLEKWVGCAATQLEVCFIEISERSSRMTLEHRTFSSTPDQGAPAARSIAHGWDGLLPRYERYCRHVAEALLT